MAPTTAEPIPQHLAALERANTLRVAGAAVRREIKRGELSLDQAITDPRAGVLTVFDLVAAQQRWGTARTAKALAALRVRETKRVRELTVRQRAMIAEECGSVGRGR